MEKAGTANPCFTPHGEGELLDAVPEYLALNHVTGKRIYRHHTDAAAFTRRHPGDSSITADDYSDGKPPVSKARSNRKTVLVARHHTDVLHRRRTPTPSVTTPLDQGEVQVTRKSVSRQGSCVQSRNQVHITEESMAANRILKSTILPKEKRKHLKRLIRCSYKRLQAHQNHSLGLQLKLEPVTMVITDALETLKKERVVLITGKPGAGKTFAANNLARTLLKSNADFKPLYISHPADLVFPLESDTGFVVIADDFLGAVNFDIAYIQHWNRLQSQIQRLLNIGKLYLILTAEQGFLPEAGSRNESQFFSLIPDNCEIDFAFEKYTFSYEEKCEILKKVLQSKRKSISMEIIKRIAGEDEDSLGFPLMCHLSKFLDENTVFGDPLESITRHINEMKTDNFPRFVVLVMTIIFGGTFPSVTLSDNEKRIFHKTVEIFGSHMCSLDELFEAAQQFNGSYLIHSKEQGGYCFSHAFILNAGLKAVVEENFESLLPLMTVEALKYFCFHNGIIEKSNKNVSISNSLSNSYTPSTYREIIQKLGQILETKDPCKFRMIAGFKIWNTDVFLSLAIAMLGIPFFFLDDHQENPLLLYFIQEGCEVVVHKVIDSMSQCVSNETGKYKIQIQKVCREACRYGSLRVVKKLFEFELQGSEETTITAAAESGNLSVLKYILQKTGETKKNMKLAMLSLCRCSHMNIIRQLHDSFDEETKFSCVRWKDNEGQSVVHYAAMCTGTDVLQFFVDKGADVTALTKDGESLLHVASRFGNISVTKYICVQYPNMIQFTDNHGFTAAHVAAKEGHSNILRYLIENNADATGRVHGANTIIHLAAINGRTDVLRYTCFIYPHLVDVKNTETLIAAQCAAKMGQIDAFQFFLDIGTDVHIKTIDGRTVLHLAAFNGKMEFVKYICKRHPELLTITDCDGNTAGHDACAGGNVEVVSYLQNLIDFRNQSFDGCTVLHDACYYGRVDVVKYLISQFKDLLSVRTNNGYTPCHGAALGGFIDILKLLLDSGADEKSLSEDGSTILHEAVYAGHTEMVKFLCSTYPDLIQKRSNKCYTPNHFAAQEGHLDIFLYILSIGGDPNSVTQENQTFLHIAAYNGQRDIVQNICDNNPDAIMMRDKNEALPIHYAARGGHENVLFLLLSRGSDPMSQTENGCTLLHLSAYDGKMDMVKLLCDRFPDLIPVLDYSGHNAAHYAAESGNLDLLSYLIEKGIDPMAETENGSTLLLKAAYNGHLGIVKWLFEKYPGMFSSPDTFGCNVAHYSACSGHIDVLSYVLQNGISYDTKTNDGHTLLHIAAYHGQINLVKYLCRTYPDLRHEKDHSEQTPEHFARIGQQPLVEKFFKEERKKVAHADLTETSVCLCGFNACFKSHRTSSNSDSKCLRACMSVLVGLLCCCRRE